MTGPNGDGPASDEAVGLLTHLLASGGEDFGALTDAAAPPTYWSSVTADQAEAEWRALFGWVMALQQRFPEMVRLPACWYRHNGLVEALAALRDHERASYAPTATPTAAAAWHVAFRDIETRLRVWISELRCGGDPRWHDGTAPAATPPKIPDDFTAWIAEDACRRGHEPAES
jgi:hypothetical protein